MGYGGKNFNFFGYTDENGVVFDGCGNTSEDKHYYNGMYIDLCGMSVEEYMKNHLLIKPETRLALLHSLVMTASRITRRKLLIL